MSEIIQGTSEWLQIRCGKVTASKIGHVLAKKDTQKYRDYLTVIVLETLTGKPCQEGFNSKDMEWGTEQEPFARIAYEMKSGNMVQQVGFIQHPEIERAGASPDGLIDEDGMVEIKCPKSSTHLDTIITGKIPNEYQNQMLWQMECSGRKWVDYVSFDPRCPNRLQLFIKRFERDDERNEAIKKAVKEILNQVDEMIIKLK